MLLRAFCHAGGVKTIDHKFRDRGFSYRRGVGRDSAHSTPSRSAGRSAERSEAPAAEDQPDFIRAFGDDGTVGMAVLPPGFTL